MKRQLLLTIATLTMLLGGCTAEDEPTIVQDEQQQEQPQELREFKLYIHENTVEMQYLTIKTKTGDGAWITQIPQQARFPVHQGDSLHISTNGHTGTTNGYPVDTFIRYQVCNVTLWYSPENFTRNINTGNQPMDVKLKLEPWTEYETVQGE